MKVLSVTIITVYNTVNTHVLGFRTYIFTVIFNYGPVISSGAIEIDKVLTFL